MLRSTSLIVRASTSQHIQCAKIGGARKSHSSVPTVSRTGSRIRRRSLIPRSSDICGTHFNPNFTNQCQALSPNRIARTSPTTGSARRLSTAQQDPPVPSAPATDKKGSNAPQPQTPPWRNKYPENKFLKGIVGAKSKQESSKPAPSNQQQAPRKDPPQRKGKEPNSNSFRQHQNQNQTPREHRPHSFGEQYKRPNQQREGASFTSTFFPPIGTTTKAGHSNHNQKHPGTNPPPSARDNNKDKKTTDYLHQKASSSDELYDSFLTAINRGRANAVIPSRNPSNAPTAPSRNSSNTPTAPATAKKGPSLSHLLGVDQSEDTKDKNNTLSSSRTDEKQVRKQYLGDYISQMNQRKSEQKGKETKLTPSRLASVVSSLSTSPRKSNSTNLAAAAATVNEKELYARRKAFEEEMKKEQRANKVNRKVARQKLKEKMENETVKLPNKPISVTDASLLFRVATKRLRKVLKAIGEFPKGGYDMMDADIMIEPESLELMAMELNRNFEVETSEMLDHHDLLLKRRAGLEAEKAETAVDATSTVPDYESLPPRPPVVCIMGHVDHGKTTLMDTLRRMSRKDGSSAKKKKEKKKKKKAKTANKSDDFDNVAGTEAGGITQVISAFQVPLPGHEAGAVTFLDTPGHAAFRSMRQSGSDAADIIVLVIAADDGVSPQTIEILNFYKSIVEGSSGSGITLVVALNKIDKPGIIADQARLKVEGQLLEHGIMPEGMGGTSEGTVGAPVQVFPISGLTGAGVEDLIEGLILQSEVMDLRADDEANAEGYVMDARVEKGLGTVADCVIRWGNLERGDYIVSGSSIGRVKFLKDVEGKMLKKASPSQPVRVVGFDSLPKAGDPLVCMPSLEEARDYVEHVETIRRNEAAENKNTQVGAKAELQSSGKHLMQKKWRETLEEKHGLDAPDDGESPIRIPIIIRADAEGSLAAICESIVALGTESSKNVLIDPIVTGVGSVLATEVQVAKESGASIICFNVKNDAAAMKLAEAEGVKVMSNEVIYRLLEESKDFFSSYLPTVEVETFLGRGKVGAVFDIGGLDTRVAGTRVIEGTLYKEKGPASTGESSANKNNQPECFYRVIRDGEIISGDKPIKSTSLKHFKEDVEAVASGDECGVSLEGHNDFEKDDIIECFSIRVEKQEL